MDKRNIGQIFYNAVQRKISQEVIETITGNSLRIQEENPKTKNSEVIITSLDKNCFAFKMDYKPRKVYLLQEDTKVNDELLIFVESNKLTVYLIEMKSDNYRSAEKQILYGKVYADFLIGILECEMGYTFSEKEYRGYIFTTGKSVSKGTTRRKDTIECKERHGIYIAVFDARQREYNYLRLSLPVSVEKLR